jgi:uncharacterized protein (DUF2384 family)
MTTNFGDLIELLETIVKFFDGNEEKATLWFNTRNPMLGGVSPKEMVDSDRTDKLLKWVKQQIEEGKAPDDGRKNSEPGK